MSSTFQMTDTGLGQINLQANVPIGQTYRIMHATCNWAAAPTTPEDFTITLDSIHGTPYDTLLYSLDPSAAATTDLVWYPDEEQFIIGGDQVDIAFTGTDNVQFGVILTLKRVP